MAHGIYFLLGSEHCYGVMKLNTAVEGRNLSMYQDHVIVVRCPIMHKSCSIGNKPLG